MLLLQTCRRACPLEAPAVDLGAKAHAERTELRHALRLDAALVFASVRLNAAIQIIGLLFTRGAALGAAKQVMPDAAFTVVGLA